MSAGTGLTAAQAASALQEHGPNELHRDAGPGALRILGRQFVNVMVWMLLAACVLSAALGEVADAVAIAVIVVINGLIGFAQEFRAERAMAALSAMTAPHARVLRDGRVSTVAARDVVPGDLLVLDAGDVVSADARLLDANALSTDEASLTGESVPVDKKTESQPLEAPLAERHDTVFAGTSIATGSGRAQVLVTGMNTELGKIAGMMSAAKVEVTPLEAKLAKVGRQLLVGCVVVVGIVAALGLARGASWLSVLVSSVSLAVAAVPEGLAAIVTIALAVGVRRMAARHALVRRLPAVEALGCVTVICTDKTGTLTTGHMRVREIWGPDQEAVLDAAAACSDAELDASLTDGIGDPTEIAILVGAAERQIRREAIEAARPRVAVYPFDSDRKRMSIRRADGKLYVKGAPEMLLPLVTDGDAAGAAAANGEMAGRGLRVLAVATGTGDEEVNLRARA